MDLWPVHVKNSTSNCSPYLLLGRKSMPDKPVISWNSKKIWASSYGSYGVEASRICEIGVAQRKRSSSFVVRAMGKKNSDSSSSNSSSSSSGDGDQSIPERDGLKGGKPSDGNKRRDPNSDTSYLKPLDWREFRALLYIKEQQAETAVADTCKEREARTPRSLPLKWAHPISAPENGCLLVATEKLDGVRSFERTVVLLLRSGTRNPQEGPFGVVINRPLHKKIKHLKPTNLDLATVFADCSLHFGGPLEASMFLVKSESSKLPLLEEVIPGVCFGARNGLDEAAGMVKKGVLSPHDFRFFVGYAGWQLDQLREEIEAEYWYVAACSPNLIFEASQNSSSEDLWEEILQLMGGHYSEVSRKPKKDI